MQVTRLSYIPYLGVEARWLGLRACPIWECFAGCNTRQWPLKKAPRSQFLSSLSRLPESSLAPTPCLDRKATQSTLSGVSRNLSQAQLCLHQQRPAAPREGLEAYERSQILSLATHRRLRRFQVLSGKKSQWSEKRGGF